MQYLRTCRGDLVDRPDGCSLYFKLYAARFCVIFDSPDDNALKGVLGELRLYH